MYYVLNKTVMENRNVDIEMTMEGDVVCLSLIPGRSLRDNIQAQ